jgi:hypothetical protein
MIKRTLSRISPKARVAALTLLAAVVVGVGVAWVVANATQPATSEEPNPVPDFSQRPLTPPPMTVVVATRIPESETGCAGPEDEVPGPGLPPLPCHVKSKEPPPGTIPTASPEERPAALAGTQNVPKGWQVYDNPMLRYTFALPPGWYANMRPEGGAFEVYSPTALALEGKATLGEGERAGVILTFLAREYQPESQAPDVKAVANPNASFNGIPGAIWDQLPPSEPTVLRMIHFAFVKDGVIFYGDAWFGQGYTDSDVDTTQKIFASITPY